MAEAMINGKVMQATIPALSPNNSPEVREDSNTTIRQNDRCQPHGSSPSSTRRYGKVVEFDLPAAKRPRPSAEITAQNVTLAIQHGVTAHIRKEAMYNACAAFDHGVEAAHDDEIRVGADTAIFKHLTFLLFRRNMIERENQQRAHAKKKLNALEKSLTGDEKDKEHEKSDDESDGDIDGIVDEITDTLRALEMVLRASIECIQVSYARIGNELLPIILGLLQEQRSQRFESIGDTNQVKSFHSASTASSTISTENVILDSKAASSSSSMPRQTGDSIYKTATKIIGHFARVGSLTDTLATTKHLLTALKQVVEMPDSASVPIEARLNSLWVIANLACSADNMIRMASHPGLVDTLVKIAHRPTVDDEENSKNTDEYLKLIRSRSIAVRAILNLSWAHENKIPLIEHPGLIGILLGTAAHRRSRWTGNGKGVSTILLQSRRHATGALRNLAAAPRRYKRRLCRLGNGTFLENLACIARDDMDDGVRDKIFATLYNLVSADTAKMFVEKKVVLDVIIEATESEDDPPEKKMENRTNAMAVPILRSLEKAIPEDEEDYDVLRPALSRFDSQVVLNKVHSTFEMNTATT